MLFFQRRGAAELPCRKIDATATIHATAPIHTTAAKHTTATPTTSDQSTTAETEIGVFKVCPAGTLEISRWCKPPVLCQGERKPRQGRRIHVRRFHHPAGARRNFHPSPVVGSRRGDLISLTPSALNARMME
jgi:hypothetical protein